MKPTRRSFMQGLAGLVGIGAAAKAAEPEQVKPQPVYFNGIEMPYTPNEQHEWDRRPGATHVDDYMLRGPMTLGDIVAFDDKKTGLKLYGVALGTCGKNELGVVRVTGNALVNISTADGPAVTYPT